MATIIVGGGIIGVSTAYYLCQSPSHDPKQHLIYIVETTSQPFQSASGYSGGFLAKDWFSSAVAPLGALSFELHHNLAAQNDGENRWGYAPSQALSLAIEEGVGIGKNKARGEDWLLEGTSRREVASHLNVNEKRHDDGLSDPTEFLNADGTPKWITPQPGGTLDVISSEGGCAQVEPLRLCEFLLGECQKRGVQLLLGTHPIGVDVDDVSVVQAVKMQKGERQFTLPCSNILITAGAWTPRVFTTLFPSSKFKIPIEPLAGHSIVVRSPRHTLVHDEKYGGSAHAVFCAPGGKWKFAPEAITRKGRDGQVEIYVAGLNSDGHELPLPNSADDRKLNPDKMKELREATVQLVGLSKEGKDVNEDDLEVVREGLCYRPVSRGGRPILSRIPEQKLGSGIRGIGPQDGQGGVFVAAGHGPWGISLSLGTGKVMAEMIRGEETSVKVGALNMN